MSSGKGRWLTGEVGAERICGLSDCLHRKLIRDRGLSETIDYAPWMSGHPRLREVAESLRWSPVSEAVSTLTLDDPSELAALHAALTRGKSFLSLEDSSIRLSSRSDPNLPEFRGAMERAFSLLMSCGTSWHLRINALVKQILPLFHEPRHALTGAGASSHDYVGGVFSALPSSHAFKELESAINLAHEIGHQSLMVYQYSDTIIEGDSEQLVFSAIRRTDRPAIMSFHAFCALALMFEFLCDLDHQLLSAAEKIHLTHRKLEVSGAIAVALEALKTVRLSPLGHGMVEEIQEMIE